MKRFNLTFIICICFIEFCNAQVDSIDQVIQQIDTLNIIGFKSSQIPILSTKKVIYNIFGRPDYIKKSRIYQETTKKHIRITQITFNEPMVIYIKIRNKMILGSLMFNDSNIVLENEGIVLNYNTKLSEIKAIFKRSFKNQFEYPYDLIASEINPCIINNSKEPLICIPFNDGNSNFILLYFLNERLLYIELFEIVNNFLK